MKLGRFIIDKIWSIILFIFTYSVILLLLLAFKVPYNLIITLSIILLLMGICLILIDYGRRKKFYDSLIINTKRMDKKYLVLETLKRPEFYEGQILFDNLYEINKSMNENVKNYEFQMNDFKEYIEMWIHEVKIPITSLNLICHNHKSDVSKEEIEQVRRLNDYVEQVLYYVRSENFEKDCIISATKLSNIIRNVNLKNKDDLLESKIDLIVSNVNVNILTDSKWLEFILNQIINNSIKYKKEDRQAYIKIYGEDYPNKFVINIYDNGIGIDHKDLNQVFKKTFTGTNGRSRVKSTGMGLYIAKNLCDKLGHTIEIESVSGDYTNVKITFSKNDFYKMNDKD